MIEILIQHHPFDTEFNVENSKGYLSSLDRINLFIGSNNSGKSRFIRALFTHLASGGGKIKYVEQDGSRSVYDNFSRNVKTLQIKAKGMIAKFSFPSSEKLQLLLREVENPQNDKRFLQKYLEIVSLLSSLDYNAFIPMDGDTNVEHKKTQLRNDFSILAKSSKQLMIATGDTSRAANDYLYIPVLRGLRLLHFNKQSSKFESQDDYAIRTNEDYFKKSPGNSSGLTDRIFSGLTLYEEIKKLLLGNVEQRKLISEFEKFLTTKLFENHKVTLIPKYDDDVLHIQIGAEDQRPIYNLGDGLQTLILILFPVFIRKDKQAIIFIEEPEIHLHPKFQKLLMEALLEMENHQYFISTHSSTILNSNKSSIYKVFKHDGNVHLQLMSFDNQKRHLLLTLGYQASDILLPNFILWVEGASDKVYFEYWVRIISEGTIVLGKHYEIMMYHGSFQSHIDLDAFTGLSMYYGVYMDGDRNSEDSQISDQKIELQEQIVKMGQYCWVSTKRSIENYIPHPTFIQAVRANTISKNPENISIEEGDYVDRGKAIDSSKKVQYKSTIRIPDEIWVPIQKNGEGSTKDIDGKLLRSHLESAIRNTGHQRMVINKIQIAEAVVKYQPPIDDAELKEKVTSLIAAIQRANNIGK